MLLSECDGWQEAGAAILQQQADEQERILEALHLAAGERFDYCKVNARDYTVVFVGCLLSPAASRKCSRRSLQNVR